jgi:hypothetical protein
MVFKKRFDSYLTTLLKLKKEEFGNLAELTKAFVIYKKETYAKIYEVEKENHKIQNFDNIGE